MPTINSEQSDKGVPLNGIVDFIKIPDQRHPLSGRLDHFNVVHIERAAYYGGSSVAYCGFSFRHSSLLDVSRTWLSRYQTCKSCHAIAMRKVPAYRDKVNDATEVQLAISDLQEHDLKEGSKLIHKRYWVYVHDEDGELTQDCGEFANFDQALDAAALYLRHDIPEGEQLKRTVRIVDNHNDSQTVWLAGPVNGVNANSMTHKVTAR